MAKQAIKPRRYIVEFRTRYLGKPHIYELDAVSATDAVQAFMLIASNHKLGKRFHSVITVRDKPPEQPS